MKGYEAKFFRRGIPFVLNMPELREGVIIGGDKNLTYYGDITENSNAIWEGAVHNDEEFAGLMGIRVSTFVVLHPIRCIVIKIDINVKGVIVSTPL